MSWQLNSGMFVVSWFSSACNARKHLKESRVEDRDLKIEGSGSRVECRVLKLGDRGSRAQIRGWRIHEDSESRTEAEESKIEDREPRIKDQVPRVEG